MAFETGYLDDPQKVGAGERFGNNNNIVLTARTFENGLKMGHFAKLDTGSLDNLDTSATPVIAGVVLRNPAAPVEDGATVDANLYDQVEYIRQGLITVRVATGETPAQFGAVYADNATSEATATDTDIAVSGEFIEEVQDGVWLIRLY
jgi:hypothetical protein